MANLTVQDADKLRKFHQSILNGKIPFSERYELMDFFKTYEKFICGRLASISGMACTQYADYGRRHILSCEEMVRVDDLIIQGHTDPNDVECQRFYFDYLVRLLAHAQCFDVLQESGIIVEPELDHFVGHEVGDNGTYWRRRNCRNKPTV